MSNRRAAFKGRTVAVVDDLSLDEQRYLYRKARELKGAALRGEDVSAFRLDDRDYSAYLIFMEDSTRTRESFRNAAKFLGARTNVFDAATSSFNKNESIVDTVKMLFGYSADSCFIVRSKLEGVCRALEDSLGRYAALQSRDRPAFINAGDGKHEHPTQEFLDEFSFLEQLGWHDERIHLALTGDLFHGRTVHSKADGLRVFREVRVDLVAPDPLMMPSHYVERMKARGYEVRLFETLDEYLGSGKVAPIWYFTRLQLERMGEAVLEKAQALRAAVTFRKDMLGKLPDGTRFYHPLPRDRVNATNPTFLDELPLNGWDGQSANGYWTRIVLMGMVSGLLGDDFEGESPAVRNFEDDFVREAAVVSREKPEVKVGIRPVDEGIVIDHISSGAPIADIWNHIDAVRCILKLNVRSSHGVFHNDRGTFKGIISLPEITSFGERDLKKLAAIAPGCTLNLIKGRRVVKKYRLDMPPRIYGFDQISCKNEACVSHPSHLEGVTPEFRRKGPPGGEAGTTFVCRYCEREHSFREIWDL
ncbi:MAG TPA: aspartate carbamoyltransferase [Rectinemataceae bacterium]|nr:aspartate carbamoyltransferase [Rectinemataceae bacterium]